MTSGGGGNDNKRSTNSTATTTAIAVAAEQTQLQPGLHFKIYLFFWYRFHKKKMNFQPQK